MTLKSTLSPCCFLSGFKVIRSDMNLLATKWR
jgi:hypothetical protein